MKHTDGRILIKLKNSENSTALYHHPGERAVSSEEPVEFMMCIVSHVCLLSQFCAASVKQNPPAPRLPVFLAH